MPGITGMGTTFNLPNFVGELFSITPSDTPFLSSIGGLSGGEAVNATQFQWQGYDLRDASQNTKAEGAPAPDAEHRVRFNVTNVLQIHQEAIDVSYTKQAATGQFSGINIAGTNPVQNEIAWQTEQMLKQIARDVEYSFIRGAYHLPSDNTTTRKTRGILEAMTTNVITNASPAPLDGDMVLDLMQKVWDNGGIKESDTATLMVNSTQKRELTRIFITEKNFQEQTRNVAGVNVMTIETDFGRVNIMLNRHMPADQLAVVSLEQCAPVLMLVPNKGFLFVESLGRIGSSDRLQIYGEIGLKYGNEKTHGKITGLAV